MITDKGDDRRVVVPSLTDDGLKLMANIAATVQKKKPSPIKKPKPECLADNPSEEDVDNFDDDDFEFTDIEWMGDEGEERNSAK